MYGGRYSFLKYSLRETVGTSLEVKVSYVETVYSLISSGVNIKIEPPFRCRVGSDITATAGIPFSVDLRENVNANVKVAANHMIKVSYIEDVLSEISLGSNIGVIVYFDESVNSSVFLGLVTQIVSSLLENILSIASAGMNTKLSANYREAIFAAVSVAFIDTYMFSVDVDLPPGAEIRVDSNAFTVTLDGQSIIHKHFGDWLFIDRETQNLQVSASGSKISGNLLYTERYI